MSEQAHIMEESETNDRLVKANDTSDKQETVKAESSSVLGGTKTLTLNTNKAGMERLDMERINRIIEETSRGSNFYKHQQRRQQEIDRKIEEFQRKLSSLTPSQVECATREMDRFGAKLEASRDLSRTIVHIDMDAFYAAVEMRDDPSLKDKPMAVGGLSMLSTSNYAARRYGVRAAMPGFIGLKLCPELVLVQPNFDKYHDVSKEVQKVFAQYDPEFSAMSLDEAYLDITDYLARLDDDEATAESVVEEIRNKIYHETRLTASAGVAPNALLAKVCSDKNKPNGQFEIPPDRDVIMEFMKDLPVRKVCGIGNVTEQILNSLGVCMCTDLWEKRGILSLLFSSLSATGFMEIALGIGSTVVKSDESRKSMSVERTFENTSDIAKLKAWCQELSEHLSECLKDKNLWGKTVTLKIKTSAFAVKTRAMALPLPTNDVAVITSAAQKLLATEIRCASPKPLELRLMGVRLSRFVSESDPSITQRQQTLDLLLDKTAAQPKQRLCPVCSSACFESVRELTSHVEDCLGSCTSEDGENKALADLLSNIPEDTSSRFSAPSFNLDNATVETQVTNAANVSSLQSTVFMSSDPAALLSRSTDKVVYTCPVCNKTKHFTSLNEFNIHVDMCLNNDTIKTILKSDDCSPPRKRPAAENKNVAKKRKSNPVTLHRFFNKS